MSVLAVVFALAVPIHDLATNAIMGRVIGADPRVCLSRFADCPPSKGR